MIFVVINEVLMQIATFKDMYIAELQELANVEDQLADVLLTMSEMASHPALKRTLIGHRTNTLAQRNN
jgi:ferritin-like metal-binding protein YciE